MPTYCAPVEDYLFLLHDVARVHEFGDLPGFADLDPEFTAAMLRSLAEFHEEVLHPVNLAADAEGARLVEGRVHTPGPYKALAQAYRDSGWLSAGISESIGGAGLPPVMTVAVSEFGVATAQSLRMYFSFCAPAAEMLTAFGADWMKAHVVPNLVRGNWTATMAMTESHCGTDLRQIRTRAVELSDGTWRLSGSKMFISGGDNDLADNVVHIVLAKVPNAEGKLANDLSTVNVFLVSANRLDQETGALTGPNGVTVGSIEHKMGLGGNATCVLNFDDCVAHRIAAPGQGTAANMAAMFFLMTYARIGVALSGVGYTEIAQQNAANYARERLSGRALSGIVNPDGPADPIIAHADIRRLLLGARSFTEGGRALAVKMALMQSQAKHAADKDERKRLNDIMDVLTPVMKAYFTDKGYQSVNDCQQVLGGHGYIADHGLEHFVRNARVGQIYEGANGIQAIDLVRRKLRANEGRARTAFFAAVSDLIDQHAGDPLMREFIAPLETALAVLTAVLDRTEDAEQGNPEASGVAAYDILTMFGITAIGWAWAEIASVVLKNGAAHLTEAGGKRKLALARLWMEREMPQVTGLASRALNGVGALMDLDSELI
ncbi:acyl-CoA dehydrogenase [Hoeflea alexandrii]|uniref:acyl-CoA dehydrogenase n=1 Tax=Hoeflea alexandrii TaxID=288436 RepID=UPI0022B04B62|nr:acyl-CoA dehydrogenase [Hoeflea alexandrii]MCZ4291590.1 acyl-CoA dehydrogenase [Hoeflea alexandrii]